MKIKIRFVTFFGLAFLCMYQSVFAAYCGKDDLKRIENVANDISIEYSLREDSSIKGMYDIIISGLTSELYIIEKNSNIIITYDSTDNGTYILEDVVGDEYSFDIIYDRCASTVVKTININAPIYNSLADSPECDNISGDELYVCDERYKRKLNKEIFDEKIKKYYENKKKEEQVKNIEKVIDFFKKNIIYIIGAIILVGILAGVIFFKKKRSSLD